MLFCIKFYVKKLKAPVHLNEVVIRQSLLNHKTNFLFKEMFKELIFLLQQIYP